MFIVRNRHVVLSQSGDLRVLPGVDAVQHGVVDEEFNCGGSWRGGVGEHVVVLCVHGNSFDVARHGNRVAVRVLVEAYRRDERPGVERIFEIVKRQDQHDKVREESTWSEKESYKNLRSESQSRLHLQNPKTTKK